MKNSADCYNFRYSEPIAINLAISGGRRSVIIVEKLEKTVLVPIIDLTSDVVNDIGTA